MRKNENCDAYFTENTETFLHRVDYDRFEDKKPFRRSFLRKLSDAQASVELDIEVEINESLQQLLNSPDTSQSDLIDVTLIRETPSNLETTVSLGKREVKRFLDMVSRNQGKKDYISRERSDYNRPSLDRGLESRPRSPQRTRGRTHHEETRPFDCLTGGLCDGQNLQTDSVYTDLSDELYNQPKLNPYNRNENVYTSPDMFSKLRSTLACQNNRTCDNQKPGTPCLCQHCGMIGVLIESQKRPNIPHPTTSSQKHRSRSEQRRERRLHAVEEEQQQQQQHHSYNQNNYGAADLPHNDFLFEDLISKLHALEERVVAQEEQAVGKDYFQYVIRKMLSQYISKVVQTELPESLKNSATQYSRAFIHEPNRDKSRNHREHRRQHRRLNKSLDNESTGSNTRPSSLERNVKFDNVHKNKVYTRKDHTQIDCNWYTKKEVNPQRNQDPPNCNKKHWKDIRNEQDLRDRILSIIEDEMGLSKNENKLTPPLNLTNAKQETNEEIKVESFQNTICLPHVIQSGRMFETQQLINNSQHIKPDMDNIVTTTAIKDLLDTMSSQIYEDIMKNRTRALPTKSGSIRYNNVEKALDDTLFKRNIEASKMREKQSFQNPQNPRIDIKEPQDHVCDSKNIKYPTSPRHVLRKDTFRNTRDNLDVTYIHPSADVWAESSNTEFAKPKRRQTINKCDDRIYPKDSLTYKIEYLKGLARSKNINEDELWRSIWRQTRNRFKSKNDILTISIPSRKRTKRPVELELTWSDLQEILRSTKSKSSVYDVSSAELLLNEKIDSELKHHQKQYTKRNHSYKQRSKSVK